MKQVLGWLFTPLFLAAFFGTLLVFHFLQWTAHKIGGYPAHKKVVDYMNWVLVQCLRLNGASLTLRHEVEIPDNVPLIVVSNHQSMFDVPMMGWLLRRHHPKYVSKKELSRGIPSVSYNLRHGGSVLIDRKDARQSLSALKDFGHYLSKNKYAGCIFPEGTRTKDGKLKEFRTRGTAVMLKYAPDAWIVPVTVFGNWEIERYRFRPMPFGLRCGCTILPPFPASEVGDSEAVLKRARAAIEAEYAKHFPV